jgi:hypothetical protein
MIIYVEQSVEWELAGQTEVLVENLPQWHFAQQKSHFILLGLEPGAPLWEAGDYLGNGTAFTSYLVGPNIFDRPINFVRSE